MAHHLRDETEMEVRILNHLGYHVLQADGAAQAMRLAAAIPNIHLLLTDFLMSGADGLQLAAQFRTVHPHTPVCSSAAPMNISALPKLSRMKDSDIFPANREGEKAALQKTWRAIC